MRIVYIADDGTEFNDEFECRHYEWILNHPNIKDIRLFDKNGNELTDIFSEDEYDNTERVFVLSKKAAEDLQALAEYTGYCCYGSITDCGEWVFIEEKCCFVRNSLGCNYG